MIYTFDQATVDAQTEVLLSLGIEKETIIWKKLHKSQKRGNAVLIKAEFENASMYLSSFNMKNMNAQEVATKCYTQFQHYGASNCYADEF